MEALLSVSFDNITSKDSSKVRKGLRQIEGLLAQICLSQRTDPAAAAKHKRNGSRGPSEPKQLSALHGDPAFREFFRLQEGFEWNVASRLIACLERLMGMGASGQSDILILSVLDLLQGALLLHPPSRALFGREIYMNLLLDLLDCGECPSIQSRSLLVLVTALLDTPSNTRTFESIDGLLTVTSLFKSRSTGKAVKMQLMELFYFYLMHETAPASPKVGVQRSSSNERKRDRRLSDPIQETRSVAEKQALLGRYISNVDDLVQDLRDCAPFSAGISVAA
ncbi:putative cell division control protein 14 protein [Lasiodiplodia theobromae]|uniref:Cell division control protein 14 n=2 Tax=Lasiodiplodia TaxID=66739 RepID=A0A5N5DUK3_9PEZI|nr:Cell division control protein 14 [Lasiodiplodia theobromae]KAB2581373.1 Cell division control protein 14 [Lasiodiplodia theobromae]KAF4539824.1 Cell division control protein 14 [Lasiodiplodia theobromae]KAF9629558.1 putative cell division control protein 14 protein [Lasiodiplodia theobromae]KAK0640085.1 Cell division control protein 14 [Lasiodiplodia hormozganensis]